MKLGSLIVAACVACVAGSLAAAVAGAHAQAAPALAQHERPIHDAARTASRVDVEALLRADASQRDVRAPSGATALHYAAMNLDAGPLQALLAAGANPNARDVEGRTPLHMAAFATRTANAKLLLRAGADPHAKTEAGRDVLSMARKVRAPILQSGR